MIGPSYQFLVNRTWDGSLLDEDVVARVQLCLDPTHLVVVVDAPFHGDPPPGRPPGSTERLWEHEVVEVFLVGAEDDYLEVELGPHGHYLVLRLHGYRNVVARQLPLDYAVAISGQRWRGQGRLPRSCVPQGVLRGNAFAIHGAGAERRHLAAHAVCGERPDFHRIAAFPLIRLPRCGAAGLL